MHEADQGFPVETRSMFFQTGHIYPAVRVQVHIFRKRYSCAVKKDAFSATMAPKCGGNGMVFCMRGIIRRMPIPGPRAAPYCRFPCRRRWEKYLRHGSAPERGYGARACSSLSWRRDLPNAGTRVSVSIVHHLAHFQYHLGIRLRRGAVIEINPALMPVFRIVVHHF